MLSNRYDDEFYLFIYLFYDTAFITIHNVTSQHKLLPS